MANFQEAFQQMRGIEYSNPTDVLHHNRKERGLTYWGIYETAHEHWEGWEFVYAMLKKHKGDLRQASIACVANDQTMESVKDFYIKEFWHPLNLNIVESQKIAEEMFFFYMNTGNKRKTVKMAQLIVGAKADGFIGIETITKLNAYDDVKFDREYDLKELEFYGRLVQSNFKRYGLNLVGWIRRAMRI